MYIIQGTKGPAAGIWGSKFQGCGMKLFSDLNVTIPSFSELRTSEQLEAGARGWGGRRLDSTCPGAALILSAKEYTTYPHMTHTCIQRFPFHSVISRSRSTRLGREPGVYSLHLEKMHSGQLTAKIFESKTTGIYSTSSPPITWGDLTSFYMVAFLLIISSLCPI